MIALSFFLLCGLIGFFTLVQQCRRTPHGLLDPRVGLLLRLAPALRADGDVEAARRSSRRLARLTGGTAMPVAHIGDFDIEGPGGFIPLRFYHPQPEQRVPLILFLHGGGWQLGDLDTHDHLCRRLARRSGLAVLAVDYRRSPEHPFPAALDDAWAALQWTATFGAQIGTRPDRLVVMGDSAGGNLAAATALRARDEQGPPIAAQVLIYPVLDLLHLDRPSYLDFAEGYYLTRARMTDFIADYIPDRDQRAHPWASPLLAPSLAHLPPTLIQTAQFDLLRDEGAIYADALEDAGVPVRHVCYPGMIHGFFGRPVFGPTAQRAMQDCVQHILAQVSAKP